MNILFSLFCFVSSYLSLYIYALECSQDKFNNIWKDVSTRSVTDWSIIPYRNFVHSSYTYILLLWKKWIAKVSESEVYIPAQSYFTRTFITQFYCFSMKSLELLCSRLNW